MCSMPRKNLVIQINRLKQEIVKLEDLVLYQRNVILDQRGEIERLMNDLKRCEERYSAEADANFTKEFNEILEDINDRDETLWDSIDSPYTGRNTPTTPNASGNRDTEKYAEGSPVKMPRRPTTNLRL